MSAKRRAAYENKVRSKIPFRNSLKQRKEIKKNKKLLNKLGHRVSEPARYGNESNSKTIHISFRVFGPALAKGVIF